MKNKNLLIGGAVVAGALLFLYFRNKQSNGEDQDLKDAELGGGVGSGTGLTTTGTGTTTGAGSGSTTTTTGTGTTKTGTPTTQLSKFEVESRVFKSCGLKPPSFKRQARNLWDDCKDRTKANLKSQGLISFNGMMEENNTRGLDFGGNIID
jgi:hypothetical protein